MLLRKIQEKEIGIGRFFLIVIELHKNDGKSFNVLRDAAISPGRATVRVTMPGFISTITAEPLDIVSLNRMSLLVGVERNFASWQE